MIENFKKSKLGAFAAAILTASTFAKSPAAAQDSRWKTTVNSVSDQAREHYLNSILTTASEEGSHLAVEPSRIW